jgi:hypothetical protein
MVSREASLERPSALLSGQSLPALSGLALRKNKHRGRLAPICSDFASYAIIDGLVAPYVSFAEYTSKTSPRIRAGKIWNLVNAAIANVERTGEGSPSPGGTPTPLAPPEMTPPEVAKVLKRVQMEMVRAFKNYSFASELWKYLLVPIWLELPRIGNIRTSSGKRYLPIEAPLLPGSSLFTDVKVQLVSVEATTEDAQDEVAQLPLSALSGLRTARSDKGYSGSKFLDFEVSGPCTIYLCWDSRCRLLPRWVKVSVPIDITLVMTLVSH